MSEKLMSTITIMVSKDTEIKLKQIALEKNTYVSVVGAIAVENELRREHPFHFDFSIPTNEVPEYEYTQEASLMLDFLKCFGRGGTTLENILLLRNEYGVPDLFRARMAFKDACQKKFIAKVNRKYQNSKTVTPTYYRFLEPSEKRKGALSLE